MQMQRRMMLRNPEIKSPAAADVVRVVVH